jgi:hypothetical protein
LSQFTVLFGVSARFDSAAIGAEPVLRVMRKGRTGVKPSGLRDELPDLPVPFVNWSTNEVAFMFRTACQAGVGPAVQLNWQLWKFAGNLRDSSPITFCVFSNTSSSTAATSDYLGFKRPR